MSESTCLYLLTNKTHIVGDRYEVPEIFYSILKLTEYSNESTPMPTWEVALKCFFYALVISYGVVGNIMVIFIVAWNRKMRSRTNVYVANLAVSDLIVLCLCSWLHLGNNISQAKAVYPFGAFLCKISVFMQCFAATASIFFLTVICGDRFFAIIFPFKARVTNKPILCAVIIVCVWAASALISLPYLFVYQLENVEWKDFTEYYCDETWAQYWYANEEGYCEFHSPGRGLYLTLYFCFVYMCPIIIMTVTYIIIGNKLWKRKLPGVQTERYSNIKLKSRKKVVEMLICVFVVFVICWTPYHILKLWSVWRNADNDLFAAYEDLNYAIQFLAYANSALNPFIYAGLNENFKAGFKEIVVCKVCKKHRVSPFTLQTWMSKSHVNRTTEVSHSVTRVAKDRRLVFKPDNIQPTINEENVASSHN